MRKRNELLGRRYAWPLNDQRTDHLLVVGVDPTKGVRVVLEEDTRVKTWVDWFIWRRLEKELLEDA